MRVVIGILGLGLLCIELAGASLAASMATNELILATGNEEGVYYSVGRAMARMAERKGFRIRVLDSHGSAENIAWLSQRKVDLCLAQGDTLRSAICGTGSFTNADQSLRALAVLYTESVHVLVRKPMHISRIEDMRGKRVSVGPAGSGTEVNAMAILAAAGLGPDDVTLVHLTTDETLPALSAGNIDVAFLTAGSPFDVVSRALRDDKAVLLGLSYSICQRLLDCRAGYVATTIEAGSYPKQDSSVDTVGVSATLVARSDLGDQVVKSILESLVEDVVPYTQQYLQSCPPLTIAAIPKTNGIVGHSAATWFFANSRTMRWHRIKVGATRTALAITILLSIIIVWRSRRRLRRLGYRQPTFRVALVLLLILLGGSLAMYLSERRLNDNYSGLLTAFWSTLCNWLNFGQKEPYSMAGRATATVMTLFGVGAISWLTAQIASVYTERRMKGGDMCDGLEGHIVVFNWNNKGPGILKALLKAEAQKREIVVITDNISFCCPPEAKDLIREVRVDTGSEESFTQGRVANANSIIILGDGRVEPDSADANNLLLVLALKKMLRESHAAQVPIIVEMSDPRKAKLSEYLTVPNEAPVEVVSAQRLAGELIVQAAVNPGLTRIYEDLLTFGSGTNEVYRWIVRGSLVGKSIVEMYERCTALRIQGVDLLPIAIERDGVLHLNPSSKECGAIQCNDVLYAICDRADIIRRLDA